MKKYVIITTISLLVLILISLGIFLYFYNIQITKEESEYTKQTEQLKQEEERKNQEFNTEQQERMKQLSEQEYLRNNADNDRDGLTYAQEVKLGTDDNNVDSDGDSIPDIEDAHPAGGGKNYRFTVQWVSKGLSRTTEFGIPEDKYFYYRNKQRIPSYEQWGVYATPHDPVIQTIAQDVADTSLTTGEYPIYAAINFVESMTYQYDIEFNSNPEYPKYPIETIVDGRGDCEDTSFLMASVLKSLGIDTIILLFSDHAAVGVACDGCTGTSYIYKGKNYFFLETTGYEDNWELGGIWGKYSKETPYVIEVS